MRPLLPALVLALAGQVLLAGCGDGADSADRETPSGAASAPAPSAETSSGVPGLSLPALPTSAPPSPEATSSEATPTAPPASELSELASRAEEEATEAPVLGAGVLGADLSWPQCPRGMGIPGRPTQGMPLPLPAAEYVIIGLTNGPGFTTNPCLADQVAWARRRSLLVAAYAVVSYPRPARLARHAADGPYDGSTRLGALRNNGHAQARKALATMRSAGLPSPVMWIDVEPVSEPYSWSSNLRANAAVVQGTARAYREAGLRIGVYSTRYLWEIVVGDLRLGVPEWRAAGETSRAEALSRCGREWNIQGGEPIMAQWVERRRDQNVTCPGTADLGTWFHAF